MPLLIISPSIQIFSYKTSNNVMHIRVNHQKFWVQAAHFEHSFRTSSGWISRAQRRRSITHTCQDYLRTWLRTGRRWKNWKRRWANKKRVNNYRLNNAYWGIPTECLYPWRRKLLKYTSTSKISKKWWQYWSKITSSWMPYNNSGTYSW